MKRYINMLIVLLMGGVFGLITPTHALAEAQQVLIIGDSMMRITAHATELQISRTDGLESHAHTSLGSGLARLDVFDWMAKIDELVAMFDPDITFAWFGTNDRQPIRHDGGVLRPESTEWEIEYARRVGEAMDKLTAKEGARIYWLELPDMRDSSMQEDVDLINSLVRAEADRRPGATFLPTRELLSRRPGTFSPYVIGPRGMPLSVRDGDGIHLNRAGADLLAQYLLDSIESD